MTRILKRKDFARWQVSESLPDAALCKAVQEMESGLIDADLGGFLYKKRVARSGGGKSGGYRTLLSARIGGRYVFLHGFPKSDKSNITQDEKKALQFAEVSNCSQFARCESEVHEQIIESLRGDLAALREAGAISKVTMREFDAICPPPVREFSATDIKRLRESLEVQPAGVRSSFTHVGPFAHRICAAWEQGDTHPTGPALKLRQRHRPTMDLQAGTDY